ncbi:MAG: glycosyltransferase family 2 protein [Candidatus Omnitrophica bacterium]|nr:glycosyltransferase family 2 protein [Candidatus Omnitrophota bacterium]
MTEKKTRISIVFPVFNEKDNIEELYNQVREVCHQANLDYEMIFVDDGSSDGSLDVVKKVRAADPNVRYLSFSRNFGHQVALFAGLGKAEGDAIITMDADLQHPPSLIPEMVKRWREGVDVVYTTKQDANIDPIKGFIVRASYWFISKISGLSLEFGQSDFRLIDKKILKLILDMPECHKFLRGQVRWLGFRQEGIPYNVEKRHAGKPKFSYRSLYHLALDGIFSFGRYPLHLIMLFSLIIFFFSSLYLMIVIGIWILKILRIVRIPMPPGWTDLIMAVCFLGSVQLMAVGVLGEYVGRIYEQTKKRPIFIVKEDSAKENI